MSGHLSVETLQQRLAEAEQQVKIGARYRHYKDSTKTYRVKELVIIEATDQIGVVYVPEYVEGLAFMRPLSNWLDKVDWGGQTVNRFTFIEN